MRFFCICLLGMGDTFLVCPFFDDNYRQIRRQLTNSSRNTAWRRK